MNDDTTFNSFESGSISTNVPFSYRKYSRPSANSTAADPRQVLEAARSSPRTFRGLDGADRYALYLAAATGFRVSALASLTPADFDTPAGTVTHAARFNKSRKRKVQPLPADVAVELARFLATKPAGVPAWGGTWARGNKAAEMLRSDLGAAGIPYADELADGPLYADFHALRHTVLTLGGPGATCGRYKNWPGTRNLN